ncbi:hypothetical protein DRJ17_02910 [Candidatus Woesearchaeota archaeon]|nr:MAG: hypothetical protein DRJ17_02910 [Candidatus Woesearchaeota archaeon]
MKTVNVLMFLYVLLVFVCAACADEKIFDRKVYKDDTIEIDDNIYTISTDQYDTKIVLFDEQSFVVDIGSCEDSPDGQYRFCFTNVSYAPEDLKIDPITNKGYPALKLVVYSYAPKIKVERTLDKKKLFVGDEVKATVVIENRGEEAASDVTYEEILPEGISIVEVTNGAYLYGRKLMWKKTIGGRRAMSFTYTFRVDSELDAKVKAETRYVYASTERSLTITNWYRTEALLKIDMSLSPASVGITEKSKLFLKIINNLDSDVDVKSVKLTLPKLVSVLDSAGFRRIDARYPTQYSTSFLLDEYDEKDFELELRGNYLGRYEILLEVEYSSKGEDFVNKVKKVFTVKSKKLKPIIEFSNKVLGSGLKGSVKAILENPDKAARYYNINVNFTSGLFDAEPVMLDVISEGGSRIPLNIEFKAPKVSKKTSYSLKMEGSYQTITGETLQFSKTSSVSVIPIDEAFKISRSFEPRVLSPGKTITIRTMIENMLDRRFTDLNIMDSYDSAFELVEGKTSTRTHIDGNQKKTVYIYKLNAPMSASIKNYAISTQITFFADDHFYNITKLGSFNLKGINPRLSVSRRVTRPFVEGSLTEVEYTVTNTGDCVVNNIVIDLLQPDFDLVNSEKDYRIDNLAKGSRQRFKVLMRPKKSGRLELKQNVFSYLDTLLREHTGMIGRMNVDVIKGKLTGPVIMIAKTIEAGNTTIEVFNQGNATNVELIDGDKRYSFAINFAEKKIFSYEGEGYGVALLSYEFDDNKYLASSTAIEKVRPTKVPQTRQIVKKKSKKGILEWLREFFAKIFSFI